MSVLTLPARTATSSPSRKQPVGVLGRRQESASTAVDHEVPWSFEDLRTAGLLAALGGLGVGICWAGASSSKIYTDQLIWTGFALLALGMALAGGFNWVLAGMRRVRYERAEVLTVLSGLELFKAEPKGIADLQETMDLGGLLSRVVVAPGMSRYHRSGCAFASNKTVTMQLRSQAEYDGLTPCEVCNP